MKSLKDRFSVLVLFLVASLTVGSPTLPVFAANHREAPITALDHKADITDWFAFVSYDDPTKVTMLLNVDPLLDPSNGPNYFPFDPEILYEMKIDNDQDGKEDIKIQFRFNTEIRLPGVFTSFVGVGNGVPAPNNSPAPVPPGTPIIPPAITALDGPGSEGFSLRQSYTVTLLKKIGNGNGNNWRATDLTGNRKLYAVPSNVGPRTMPNYENLARQGIYNLNNGIKVFAGTVDDPFYIDLGAAFDTLNLRTSAFGTAVPGVLTDAQDGDDAKNFAPDAVAGFNVNTIAVEIPITMLTSDGSLPSANNPKALIGTYGTTSRPRTKVLPSQPGGKPALSNNFVQIQRMGNPLINELIIGTGDKDKFSMSDPSDDAQFAPYFLDPVLARVLNAAYGGVVQIPTPPRVNPANPAQDLGPLAFYSTLLCPGCQNLRAGPVADFLRLNIGIPPTAKANRKRLGALAGDFGGFPNGRRVSDDVFDISARAVAGVLAGGAFASFPNNRIGDAVNSNDRPYQETFPYVAFANSGRNSRHQNPGTSGCADALSFLPTNCPTD